MPGFLTTVLCLCMRCLLRAFQRGQSSFGLVDLASKSRCVAFQELFRYLPAIDWLYRSATRPAIFAGSRDRSLQQSLWLLHDRVDHFPSDCFQWNLDSTLPATVELSCGPSDVDVDEPAIWWTLRDWATKIWRTIITIAFYVDRAFENQTACF